jgi:hypothetical protein
MRSNSVVAVGWRGLFCRSSGGSIGSVYLLIVSCMVVLVLRIAYGQVVLLRTVLNFVA